MEVLDGLRPSAKKGWKDYEQGELMGYGLDRICIKPRSLLSSFDYYISMKRFDVLDAKELMVWHSKLQVIFQKLWKNPWNSSYFYIILQAARLSADALLLIKTGALNLNPHGQNGLIVVDEENGTYYGEFQRPLKEVEKIVFGR